MGVAVYDTYVRKKDSSVMHFDILVPDTLTNKETIYGYGREYLKSKGQEGLALTAQECAFCHVEQPTLEMEAALQLKGYYIIEMQGCQ
ncbi:DUF2024 family protein [Hymenobacter sp. IS2118]|uniref:DUF2024 family protein n=1 Tax=Hymenobacter sp. IS2118 TaxID=1505605 RepID=UPI00054DE1DB|nr:DUF2024 family protein [Hymenobacter sp. IS2118]